MIIQDTLHLIDRTFVPSGSHVSSRSIMDRNINDLIDRLREKSIEIDIQNSEQSIEYFVFGVKRNATVPLQASFEDYVKTNKYFLRNKKLEIILTDYHKTTSTSGRIGGTLYHEKGVVCLLKLNCTDEDLWIWKTAKTVLEEFYM